MKNKLIIIMICFIIIMSAVSSVSGTTLKPKNIFIENRSSHSITAQAKEVEPDELLVVCIKCKSPKHCPHISRKDLSCPYVPFILMILVGIIIISKLKQSN